MATLNGTRFQLETIRFTRNPFPDKNLPQQRCAARERFVGLMKYSLGQIGPLAHAHRRRNLPFPYLTLSSLMEMETAFPYIWSSAPSWLVSAWNNTTCDMCLLLFAACFEKQDYGYRALRRRTLAGQCLGRVRGNFELGGTSVLLLLLLSLLLLSLSWWLLLSTALPKRFFFYRKKT